MDGCVFAGDDIDRKPMSFSFIFSRLDGGSGDVSSLFEPFWYTEKCNTYALSFGSCL
jgi:hypothetical protein